MGRQRDWLEGFKPLIKETKSDMKKKVSFCEVNVRTHTHSHTLTKLLFICQGVVHLPSALLQKKKKKCFCRATIRRLPHPWLKCSPPSVFRVLTETCVGAPVRVGAHIYLCLRSIHSAERAE